MKSWNGKFVPQAVSSGCFRQCPNFSREPACLLVYQAGGIPGTTWRRITQPPTNSHRIRMYAIYGNIYHQYTLIVSMYTIRLDPMGSTLRYFKLWGRHSDSNGLLLIGPATVSQEMDDSQWWNLGVGLVALVKIDRYCSYAYASG